jgi:hypothetical protein
MSSKIRSKLCPAMGDRKVAQSKILVDNKEYLLRIVYENKGESRFVITAYLTSQVGRYWKEGEK